MSHMHKKAPRKEPFQIHQFIKITYDAYKKYYNKFYKHNSEKYKDLDYAFFATSNLAFAYKFHHYFNEEGIRRFSRESFKFRIFDKLNNAEFRFKSLSSELVYLKCKFYKFNITGIYNKDGRLAQLQDKMIYPKDPLPQITMYDYFGFEYHPFDLVYRMIKILDTEKIRNLIIKPEIALNLKENTNEENK